MGKINQKDEIRTAVRDRYGKIADNIQPGCGCSPSQFSCCDPGDDIQEKLAIHLYQDTNVSELPSEVTDISLGCGDPVTLASLTEGQTVLDLGSGGGIDCFLAAKKVGQTGKVIGVDMTQAMIDRARTSQEKMGVKNVEFRLGEIENLPVSDDTIDVIISNCVINLSPDKSSVFREAYRVLKPGGKLAVSDIVTDGDLPEIIMESLIAWAGCIAGAIDVDDYVNGLQEAGFGDVQVKASYWDPEYFEAAVEQLEPELKARVLENKKNERKTLIDGVDKDFDPQKSIFSAKITAWKPS